MRWEINKNLGKPLVGAHHVENKHTNIEKSIRILGNPFEYVSSPKTNPVQ